VTSNIVGRNPCGFDNIPIPCRGGSRAAQVPRRGVLPYALCYYRAGGNPVSYPNLSRISVDRNPRGFDNVPIPRKGGSRAAQVPRRGVLPYALCYSRAGGKWGNPRLAVGSADSRITLLFRHRTHRPPQRMGHPDICHSPINFENLDIVKTAGVLTYKISFPYRGAA
jgi:hypothetical protein